MSTTAKIPVGINVTYFVPPPCQLLCCPVASDHDRTHPACVVAPRLWQDNGDQA